MRLWSKTACAASGIALASILWLAWEARDLPSVEDIRHRPFSRYVPKGQSTWVPLWAISPKLQAAVLVWEDPPFFHHSGFNFDEMAKAVIEDLRAGRYQRGASTITQQVAKNLFLDSEKTLRRKLREAILTRRLERALSKEEILLLYLNIAEWGDGVAGAEAASRRYFSKSAEDLNWAEAALLAGILPNPRHRNPCENPSDALRARHAVLTKLLRAELLSPQEFQEADAAPSPGCDDPTPPASSAQSVSESSGP